MKKLLVALLAVALLLTAAACSLTDRIQKIKDYVSQHTDSLRTTVVDEALGGLFTEHKESVKTAIRVEDRGLVFDITLGDLFQVEDATKTQIQESVENRQEQLQSALDKIQEKLPILRSITVNLLDTDGNLLANVTTKD